MCLHISLFRSGNDASSAVVFVMNFYNIPGTTLNSPYQNNSREITIVSNVTNLSNRRMILRL